MRHFIDPTDFTVAETDALIRLAEQIIASPREYAEVMRGKKLATLFYEPSTRTRLSFEAAMMELGGGVLGFSDAGSSSVTKGETVADTARVVSCFADVIAMRHPMAGAPAEASRYASVPVINAGDGSHSHPTQTLTDMLTIHREKGRLSGLTVGFCGDLKYGRTVHSLIKALSRYPDNKFVLISPEQLKLPAEYRQSNSIETTSLEEALPSLDVLYMTRVQRERFEDMVEYELVKDGFVLDAAKMHAAKQDMIVLHPLPRVNEIATDVDADPRAAYFRQVRNGKYIRMALILSLLSM